MYSTTLLASLALIVGATANPLPAADPLPVEQSLKPRGSNAKVNQPITDAEWANLKSGGTLKPRSSTAKVNQPITDAEWANLKSGGLQTRNEESSLVVRDNVLNCGHLVTGTGGNAGHGVWIPVAQFADVANTFCKPFCEISSPQEKPSLIFNTSSLGLSKGMLLLTSSVMLRRGVRGHRCCLGP